MRKPLIMAVALLLVLAACGGDDGDDSASSTTSGTSAVGGTTVPAGDGSDNAGSVGQVVDPPPPGQATASVDGENFSFELPGGVACNIADGEFSFSFRSGDNEVRLGGGGFEGNSGWGGDITLIVPLPEGQEGSVSYFASLFDHGASALAFDGNSMSYSGPMQKQPPSDDTGSDPGLVDVGDGTISVTCP